jgi:O-antigen biosynthesis protein
MSRGLRISGEPAVSIVLVTSGGWRWTEIGLQSLAKHTTGSYEVIVVDNASPDATVRRLHARDDIEVVCNDSNRGLGPACNQGAAVARGRYLVFLNTNTAVHPGWLEPLVSVLDSDPTIGAVGPRLVYPDGRLQEAGMLIAQDGTVLQYGDGESADNMQFRFRRTVDCCSGACLAVRREAFNAIGGFDPVWVPAYYEGIDLCLRLRDAGLAVIFEPAATVTHIRSGARMFDGPTQLFLEHRRQFVARWSHRLPGRPPSLDSPSPTAILAARDASARGRVLICDDRLDPAAVSRSSAIVASVLTALPDARVTWRTDAVAAGRLDPGPWLRRGVELVDDPTPDWLASRRFGLDVIFSGAVADPRFSRALDETQPQAHRVQVDTVNLVGLQDSLADAGLAV